LKVVYLQLVKLGEREVNEGFKNIAMVKEAGKINWEVSFRVRSEWGRPKVKQLLDYIMVSVSTGPMQGCEKGVLILYVGIGSVFEEEVNEFFAVLCFSFVFEHAGESYWSYTVLCGSV
jgi:hypothetical protein